MLEGKLYFCGYDYSIADIAYYNELTNILSILNEVIDPK